MLIIFLFLIFVGSHSHIINLPVYISEINECGDYSKTCNPKLEVPCCDSREECRVINWRNYTTTFICLQTALLNEHCHSDLDCLNTYNMFCNEHSQCQCKQNMFALNSTTCVAFLGKFCSDYVHCPTNAICVDNQCQCKPEFIQYSDKQCDIPTMLGKYCKKDESCQDYTHMECSDHKCVCQKNRIANNGICEPLLGELCWTNEKCAPAHSICHINKCQCEPNYTSVSIYKCVPNFFFENM